MIMIIIMINNTNNNDNDNNNDTTTIRASQSLSDMVPSTGYNTFPLKGATLRGNHVARIGI